MSGPHANQRIVQAGAPLLGAARVFILLHGRGGSAEDILGLGGALASPGDTLLAPEAAGRTWYPYSFLNPREDNEPYLTSALSQVQAALDLAIHAGVSSERVILCGFSQGACLSTEFTGRNPRRYGALIAFTGGLIGPPDEPIVLEGDLAGTPVLLSSGDPDPHVPWTRVQQSGDLLSDIGAAVTLRRYPGRPHTVSQQEVEEARTLLQSVAG